MAWTTFEAICIVIKYALIAIVLQFALVCGYRLTLHPLSKYPGPIIAATTDWYVGFFAALKRQHLVTYSNHQKYGTVIRQGPNKLVFNSHQALHDIYQSEKINKVRSYLCTQIKSDTYSIFNCLDKDLHRIKRRIISKALSEQKMRRFEPVLLTHVDRFLALLLRSHHKKQAVNMSERFKRLGLEIIGKFGFGYDLKLQTEEEHVFVVKGMEGGSYRNNVYIQAPSLRWLGIEFLLPALYKLRMKYFFLLKRLIKERLAEGKDAKEDLFSYVVDAKDPETGTKIRMSELWSEATFFFPAGGDTTATTLTAAFFYLSRNPECYSRLTSEIRSKWSSGTDIRSGTLLSSCTYLRAVLDETMRVSPPLCGTLWRELPVSEYGKDASIIIDGHVVPAGTWVGVNTYTIHHNEHYFPDPFSFKPERWLPENRDNGDEMRRMQGAFAPFGVGSRSCPGKVMAFMEASLVLAKSVWYFDFSRSQDPKLDKIGGGSIGSTVGRDRVDEFQLYDQFISSHDGPYLTFEPRDGAWKDLE
ncbi:cytochrome P450 [Aaosphaeria arxii CBS 175.79]|uniref:Cytochrome P450 n=1 Tax=Aaosphaeria arxii CBS 175.79 TaxID=1450172 RepID=A0A6A5XV05_9PLEO|nr:cytochrome P450 [Aaosphaeria arxii CBS 175.79]KAF2016769.1 cytochrome P450 [Aaosphaeria arxii CBS 175.79]